VLLADDLAVQPRDLSMNWPLLVTWGISAKSAGTTVTGVYGRTPAQNNLLVAVVTAGASTAATFATSQNAGTSGWTKQLEKGNNPSGTSFAGVAVWTKVAGASEAAPVFALTIGASNPGTTCVIYEVYNPGATPVDVSGFVQGGSVAGTVTSLSTATSANPTDSDNIAMSAMSVVFSAAATTSTFAKGAQAYRNIYNDNASSFTHSTGNIYAHGALSTSQVYTDAATLSSSSTSTYWVGVVVVIQGGTTTIPAGTLTPAITPFSVVGNGAANINVFTRSAGDVLILSVKIANNTVSVGSVADSNGFTSGWTRLVGPFIDTQATPHTQEIWMGNLATAGSTQIQITYSGTIGATSVEIDFNEFSIGWGTATTWSLDPTKTATLNQGTASTTHTWPSLTPTDTRKELIVGRGRVPAGGNYSNATPTATGTTVYSNVNANPVIYSLGITAATSMAITDTASVAYYLAEAIVRAATVIPVAGSGASSSSTSAGIGAVGAIAGSASSSSSTSGAVVTNAVISGASAASSSATGAIVVKGGISGSNANLSSATGTVVQASVIAGTAAPSSSASGAVVQTLIAAGISSSQSGASGTIGRVAPLAGSAAAVSVGSGAVSVLAVLQISGLAGSSSAAAGAAVLIGVLAGTAASASTASGTVGRAVPLGGQAASSSSASGAVTIQTGPITWPLTGTAPAVSQASGALTAQALISGSAVSAAAAAGTVTARLVLAGTAAAISSSAGAIYTVLVAAGRAASASTASGQLTSVMIISGTAAAVSQADGTVQPPFTAGAMPDKITAIVFVVDGPRVSVVVSTILASVETDSIHAEVT